MSRNITGTNSIPLGPSRMFGRSMGMGSSVPDSSGGMSSVPDRSSSMSSMPDSHKRPIEHAEVATQDVERGRKRKSRWATSEDKASLSGIPTALSGQMSKENMDQFLIYVRLEEIGRKLASGRYVPDDRRSPSPQPIYGTDGKRINTREYRYRKKLEDERHQLVQQAQKMDPQFVPPTDYQRPRRTTEKIYIPVRDYPDINFIGLLIGPRGHTLKKMETESGAKISIRGKGSVKEGKMATANDGLEEDLHCLISSEIPEKVAMAVKLVDKIIETAVSTPEVQNDLKRSQLRELASLNGTLRDDENQPCLNCGQLGHRRYECKERRNFTINLTCRICGGAGHASRDCRERNNPRAQQSNQKLDAEYMNLMAELGEPADGQRAPAQSNTGHYGPSGAQSTAADSSLPPWQQQHNQHNQQSYGGGAGGGQRGSGDASAVPPWQQPRSGGYGRPRGGHQYQGQQGGNNYGQYGGGQGYYGSGASWGGQGRQGGYGGGGYGGYSGGGYGAHAGQDAPLSGHHAGYGAHAGHADYSAQQGYGAQPGQEAPLSGHHAGYGAQTGQDAQSSHTGYNAQTGQDSSSGR